MPTNQPVGETGKLDKLTVLGSAIFIGLVVLGGLVYVAWWAISQMSRGALIAWALIELVLLPLVGYAGYAAAKFSYKLGKVESDGIVKGIGLGTGPVVQTAEKVADVKLGAVRQLRQSEPVQTIEVQLPVVDVVPRRLPSGQDVIDL